VLAEQMQIGGARTIPGSADLKELRRVADEQAALRRLATLIARSASPGEIFGAVACELGQIMEARHAAVIRYEQDGTATSVGIWNAGHVATLPLGSRFPLEKGTVRELVARTKAPERIDDFEATVGGGVVLAALHSMGVKAEVGCPVKVRGRLWGVVLVASTSDPLPEGTEERMLNFTELLAAAIENADSRAELQASRARILTAADATRRLIERDLHDRMQQRLVSLILEMRAAEATVPPRLIDLRARLSHMAEALDEATEDLREIARGLHPALLSRKGIEPALRTLSRRSPIPVELNMHVAQDLAERFEGTAYHIVSEALTNAAEHAHASAVHVDLVVEGAIIRLAIRDDGKEGADPDRGSGLLNIKDRVEALGGTLKITSPAGGGTSLLIEIPITDDR
jgi:signal transduction histidine kinase